MYVCVYIFPKNCGCMKLRTYNKANSLVLNPTVEMNKETFQRSPNAAGRETCLCQKSPADTHLRLPGFFPGAGHCTK